MSKTARRVPGSPAASAAKLFWNSYTDFSIFVRLFRICKGFRLVTDPVSPAKDVVDAATPQPNIAWAWLGRSKF